MSALLLLVAVYLTVRQVYFNILVSATLKFEGLVTVLST